MRHARRLIEKLRVEPAFSGMTFKVYFQHPQKGRKRPLHGRWQLICARTDWIVPEWDQNPLFFEDGCPRHVRDHMRKSKIDPQKLWKKSDSFSPPVSDKAWGIKGKVISPKSQQSENGLNPDGDGVRKSEKASKTGFGSDAEGRCGAGSSAGRREIAPARPTQPFASRRGMALCPPIARLAGAKIRDLSRSHWDNCKVVFDRRLAWSYLYDAFIAGHRFNEVHRAYDRALRECHGLATDMILDGKLSRSERFLPTSTIARARQRLLSLSTSPSVLTKTYSFFHVK